MEKINFMIQTVEGDLYAFSDEQEFLNSIAELMKENRFRQAWSDVSEVISEFNRRKSEAEQILEAVRESFRFTTKIKKNGVFADGTPRLVIPIPKKLMESGWFDIKKDWEIFIVSPGTVPESADIFPPDKKSNLEAWRLKH